MATIRQGVRELAVKAEPDDLAHVRNREDAPVLARAVEELNLLGGDVATVTTDPYEAEATDRFVLVSASGSSTVVLPGADGLDGKLMCVRKQPGAGTVTVEDASGTTLGALTSGQNGTWLAHDGAWVLVGS